MIATSPAGNKQRKKTTHGMGLVFFFFAAAKHKHIKERGVYSKYKIPFDMEGVVTVKGLCETEISVPKEHIHGDPEILTREPQNAHLFIRRVLPKTTPPQGSLWRSQNTRSALPSLEKPTPTFFREQVYPHVQHALFACLIWNHGGSKKMFHYNTFPGSFPMVCVQDAGKIFPQCANMKGEVVGLHWLESHPSHTQVVELGRSLKESNIRWCMLMVGNIKPVDARWPAGQPQFHCMLVDANFFEGTQSCFQTEAVSLGWQICLAPALCFVLHGAMDGKELPPATLPPLLSMSLRLWRRTDTSYFAIDGKVRKVNTWEAAIHRALENQVMQSF